MKRRYSQLCPIADTSQDDQNGLWMVLLEMQPRAPFIASTAPAKQCSQHRVSFA